MTNHQHKRTLYTRLYGSDINITNIYVSEKLRAKIFRTAKKLGYVPRTPGQSTLRTTRITQGIPAAVQFVAWDGSVRDKGTAKIDSLFPRGAVLSDIRMDHQVIRLEPSYLILNFRLDSTEMELKCDFARMYLDRFIRISVKFTTLTEKEHKLLMAHMGNGDETDD